MLRTHFPIQYLCAILYTWDTRHGDGKAILICKLENVSQRDKRNELVCENLIYMCSSLPLRPLRILRRLDSDYCDMVFLQRAPTETLNNPVSFERRT